MTLAHEILIFYQQHAFFDIIIGANLRL